MKSLFSPVNQWAHSWWNVNTKYRPMYAVALIVFRQQTTQGRSQWEEDMGVRTPPLGPYLKNVNEETLRCIF